MMFSRQSRNQTQADLQGGGSLRRVAQPNASAASENFRSQTLNRLEMLRARQAKAKTNTNPNQNSSASATSELQRNRSALANHPPVNYGRPTVGAQEIYSPTSIATAAELAPLMRPTEESQHYAASSCQGVAGEQWAWQRAASQSSRSSRPSRPSRPDSALGQLFERTMGTLRRRARWMRRDRAPLQSRSPQLPAQPPPPSALAGTSWPPGELADGTSSVGDYATPSAHKLPLQAEAIYAEGAHAIDGNSQRRLLEHQLDESLMVEGETRTLIGEESRRQADYLQLVGQLRNWINDELAQQRIVVRDLQDDLHDGQILGKLIEKLHDIRLDLVEVTQNESSQRHKLRTVLETINRILSVQARWARIGWTVDGIHSKNMVEIVRLLVALAIHYRAPMKLPTDVNVRVLVVQKLQGQLIRRSHEVQLNDAHLYAPASQASGSQRDAFDVLVDLAPDKLATVKRSLVRFANRHLNKISLSCSPAKQVAADGQEQILEPEQFSDGLLLVFLIASLENYFVPLGHLFTCPPASAADQRAPIASPERLPDLTNNLDANNNDSAADPIVGQTAIEPSSYTNTQPIHKLHNVNVALQLIEEAGICIRDKVRAEDIVNADLKSILRVLYALFSRYKHL